MPSINPKLSGDILFENSVMLAFPLGKSANKLLVSLQETSSNKVKIYKQFFILSGGLFYSLHGSVESVPFITRLGPRPQTSVLPQHQ